MLSRLLQMINDMILDYLKRITNKDKSDKRSLLILDIKAYRGYSQSELPKKKIKKHP
jgi:hypothetical protein